MCVVDESENARKRIKLIRLVVTLLYSLTKSCDLSERAWALATRVVFFFFVIVQAHCSISGAVGNWICRLFRR